MKHPVEQVSLNLEDHISADRQEELVRMAEEGYPATAIRQAAREVIQSLAKQISEALR